MNDFLTVKEVAELLKASPLTVWRWCRSGKVPAFQIGAEWRIRREDLDQAIRKSIKKNARTIKE